MNVPRETRDTLDTIPPGQILAYLQRRAGDPDTTLTVGDLVTTASNVADPEDLIEAAERGEV